MKLDIMRKSAAYANAPYNNLIVSHSNQNVKQKTKRSMNNEINFTQNH
jgi:hypothetical protein